MRRPASETEGERARGCLSLRLQSEGGFQSEGKQRASAFSENRELFPLICNLNFFYFERRHVRA